MGIGFDRRLRTGCTRSGRACFLPNEPKAYADIFHNEDGSHRVMPVTAWVTGIDYDHAMGPCAECGADRLVPMTFQAARAAADDLERPDVVIMRPIAKCGGCGARIYLDRLTRRGDPGESAPN